MKKQSKPIKILQILPALNYCGGIENYVMNYYRHLDKDIIQSDFITHTNLEASYESEIINMGGRVFKFPVFTLKNLFNIIKRIDKFFTEHEGEYSIVHCHMANAACFYFWLARKHSIKIRILHSHQPASAAQITHKIRNYPLLYFGNLLATNRIACTKLAGDFLFKKNKYTIIRNAIDVRKFLFDENRRNKIRREYDVSDKFVVGNVGRLAPPKNQSFLLKIFKEIINRKENAELVLIGAGEDEYELKKEVKDLGLINKVHFLGVKENVWDYYQLFDVFVFPSLYEGLGIVLIEAQCSGLKVFASSEHIPKDVKITSNLEFCSLKETPSMWADRILKDTNYKRTSQIKQISVAGYDIDIECKKLENYYINAEELD